MLPSRIPFKDEGSAFAFDLTWSELRAGLAAFGNVFDGGHSYFAVARAHSILTHAIRCDYSAIAL
jgi:hypothetical protein